MTVAVEVGTVLRFGEFELDAANAELRRDGASVRLPPQPFRVLVLLATRAGQLVTRDEIQQCLWGSETAIDVELGINYCLNQLRRALGDETRAPRFLETVPRRGYRFIASVEAVRPPPNGGAAPSPSIAVLPFANLSAEAESVYFSDGLADEVITALTRVDGLRVTARTSSFAFRGVEQDVREIGGRLGVSTLLEGSVQRAAGRVRISAQLVNVADGFHLWSEHYDRDLTDVFAIQDEISRSIARALALRLTPSQVERPTPSLEAYNAWLKARHYHHREDPAGNAKARECLREAIALDSRFPHPYLTLADLALGSTNLGMTRPLDAAAEGRTAIRKALELDPSLGEAHALSGAFRALMDYDWEGAAGDFARALELAPASERVHRLYAGFYLVPTLRLVEAEEEMERALASDVLCPTAHVELVQVLMWARQFERAEAKGRVALDLWPGNLLVQWFHAGALFFQGHYEETLKVWRRVMETVGGTPGTTAGVGMALAMLGREEEARSLLERLEEKAGTAYVPALSRAKIYTCLREKDATLYWLDVAIDEHEPEIFELPSKAIWDHLRDDPRFTALLRKMRLA